MAHIDSALLCSFIEVESSFRSAAFLMDRNGGSYGLAQIDVSTAQWAGFKGAAAQLYAPRTNLTVLAAILTKIALDLAAHDKFSLTNLAAAYNSGLAHVLGGGADDNYASKIIAAYSFWTTALESAIPPILLAA